MKIIAVKPNEPDAEFLMEELSETLAAITGDSGKNSFDPKDVCMPRALFVIAYNDEGNALGCGAIRPISENIAEVKRMYVKNKSKGVGTEILKYLEVQAKDFGYTTLYVETRLINNKAVLFYERRGYHRILNYGKYASRPEAVCFEKQIN